MKEKGINSLEHTKWRCQYHIVFAPKYSVAQIMGFLKGKSSLMIFDRHANLKYKYGNRHFGKSHIIVRCVFKSFMLSSVIGFKYVICCFPLPY